jgi:predicted transposase YbfD/YdcC
MAAAHFDVEEVLVHFQELEDPRSDVNLKHPFVAVVVIALMAVLAGASGPTAIARWAAFKQDLLVGVFGLVHGVPRKDVFRRVLSTLAPNAFQECFGRWLQKLRSRAAAASGVDQPVFAVDGKTLRRSHDRANGLGALHSVSVWATEYGLSLGQVACDQKSNEITAIPELLRLVDVAGAIVTIDAMGCQTEIADTIVERGADYVLAVKGNQEGLHKAIVSHFDSLVENDMEGEGLEELSKAEKGHGREEVRVYVQTPVPADFAPAERWKNIESLGMAVLDCIRDGKQTTERRYFISTLPVDVERFSRAVRGHWGIENTCHWSLDVTFGEDQSRIRNDNLRNNFAWMNRVALSLLKQHPAKTSLVGKRQACSWDDKFLLQVVTGETG